MTCVIVWLTFAGSFFGLLGLAHLLKHHVRLQKKKTSKTLHHAKENADPDRTGRLIEYAVYLLYFLAFMLLVCVACMWRNISISIAIMKTSALIVFRNIRMLLMPLASGFFVMLWTVLWFYFFVMLVSTGEIKQPVRGSQAKSITFTAT